MSENEKPPYRLLTGTDDHAFCVRVSDALAEGYILHGSPSCTYDPNQDRMLVAQAIILPIVQSSPSG